MKNQEHWTPSKFVFCRGRLQASRDVRNVTVGSRLISDLTAKLYQQYLPQHCRGRLVDLGCGRVPLFEAYRNHVESVTCVDWPGSAHGNEFIDVAHDLSQPLPFDDGEFDTIVLSDVLEHMSEPQLLCNEMARILSPGGKCLLNTPFFYWLHEVPHDYYRYTEFALRTLMGKAGFNVLLAQPTGGSPEILADIVAKHLSQVPVFGKPTAMFAQWLTSVLVRTPPGRKLSKSTAQSFPLSYFLVAEKK